MNYRWVAALLIGVAMLPATEWKLSDGTIPAGGAIFIWLTSGWTAPQTVGEFDITVDGQSVGPAALTYGLVVDERDPGRVGFQIYWDHAQQAFLFDQPETSRIAVIRTGAEVAAWDVTVLQADIGRAMRFMADEPQREVMLGGGYGGQSEGIDALERHMLVAREAADFRGLPAARIALDLFTEIRTAPLSDRLMPEDKAERLARLRPMLEQIAEGPGYGAMTGEAMYALAVLDGLDRKFQAAEARCRELVALGVPTWSILAQELLDEMARLGPKEAGQP